MLKVGEVVCGLSSWLSVRPSTSLTLAGVRALRGRPLSCCQSILPVMSIFLIEVFTINIPLSIWKHLTQTCGSITLANSQALYQMSIFNGKTGYLQTRKYDVRITSPVAMNILTFSSMEYFIHLTFPENFVYL